MNKKTKTHPGQENAGPEQAAQTAQTIEGMVLTKEQKDMVLNLVHHIQKMELEKEAFSEDVAATAERLGVKPAIASKIAKLVHREQTKGGVLNGEKSLLDLVEQIVE